MRACEGCRRRKIKCDAATNNHWPCSACQRLKLVCVPPAAQYERDFGTGQVLMNQTHHIQYSHVPNPSNAEQMLQAQQRMMRKASAVEMPTYHRAPSAYQHTMGIHEAQHQQPHPHAQGMPYPNMGTGESMHSPVTGIPMQQPVYHSPPPMQQRQPESWSSPQHHGSEYSDEVAGAQLRMENLAVDDAGVGESSGD